MENHLTADPIQALRRLFCLRHRAIGELFADFPLQDPAQYNLLICIDRLSRERELPNQRELCREIHRSPATVAASLKVLERQGLIRRTQDQDDQRVNRVALTETGSAMAERCRERMSSLERQVIQGFSSGETEELTRLLDKMIDNLSRTLSEKKEAHSID